MMRKPVLQILSLVIVLSMLLAACAPKATPQPSEQQPTAQQPQVEATQPAEATKAPEKPAEPTTPPEPVAIRIFTNQPSSFDFTTNSFTKEVEQNFNLKITWETTTTDGGSALEKRQLSLASGDYPDLYLISEYVDPFSQTDLLKYGQQGVFLPLNDLIDQYAPNLKAALEKYPYFKAMTVAPDGKIYGIGHFSECYHCAFIQKILVNTKWRKNLNIEEPKTTEEFKAMLEAFKTKDPNGNGVADEIPMVTAIGQGSPVTMLMNAFIYDDLSTHLIMKDGKVDINANKPEWKEGLLYINSLSKEGLLDPASFTQNWEGMQKIGNADPPILGVGGLFPWYISQTYVNDYDFIPPLTGPKGVQYSYYTYPGFSGAYFVLTNKASPEAQVAAIKLLDYLFTPEGELRAVWGEEGKDWRKPKEGEIALDKNLTPLYATIPLGTDEKPHNTAWEKIANFYWPADFINSQVQAADIYTPEGFERRLFEATLMYDGKQPKEVFPYWAIWVDPTLADETAMLKQNITDYINQNAVQFITGTKDIEKEWDAYVAGLDALGLSRYLEIMQQSYDTSFKK
jgi:putative aldouronate transport system substrate-binding protein